MRVQGRSDLGTLPLVTLVTCRNIGRRSKVSWTTELRCPPGRNASLMTYFMGVLLVDACVLDRVPLQRRPRTTNAWARMPRCALAVSLVDTASAGLRMRNPACSPHERPPLMRVGMNALRRSTFCQRSAVVFRPFNSWIRSPVLGAGVEPATDDLSGRCSTRLSYPVVVIPGIEPGTARCNH